MVNTENVKQIIYCNFSVSQRIIKGQNMLKSSYPNLGVVKRWDILEILTKISLHNLTNCVSELLVSLSPK